MKSNGSEIYGRIPPQDKEAERAVLGALMLEPHSFDIAIKFLKPESFYVENHQEIFRAIAALNKNGTNVDIITVVDALRGGGVLERVGGPYAITQLTNAVVSSANIENHCAIIHQHFIGREIIRLCGTALGNCYEPGTDGIEEMMNLDKEITRLSEQEFGDDAKPMADVLVDTLKKVEAWRNMNSSITGVSSGFGELDTATRGWQPGDLVIVAARPSVGKTAFALSLVRNAARADKAVAMWSLEMASTSLALRMLSAESGMILHALQTGGLDDAGMNTLYKKGVDPLVKTKIFIDDAGGLTLTKIKAKARRLKRKHDISLMVIDYLQLMEDDERENNRERQIAKTSRGLKNLAMELQIPIIALSQLSRNVESRVGAKRVPMLSDLRESGAIEQDADVVVFLWAPDEDDIKENASLTNIRHVKVAKQRNGTLATFDLEFQSAVQQFADTKKFNNSGWQGRSPLGEKDQDPF
jgi:replicative DNA helicase